MADHSSVSKARAAADNAAKSNKGRPDPTLEAALAREQAAVVADHRAKGQIVPQWATNRH